MLLSVVATSRNDDHGGNALWRTQHFVDGLAHQAKKHRVSIELVLVDWNPLPDRVGLYEALKWPEADKYFQYRVIVVPNSYHQQFKHSKELPLFQYLAKNVGIRRAKGDFILATNIDILFSDQLFQFFKTSLKTGCLYRVDRFDMDDKIPEAIPFEEILSYAEKNILRVNAAMGILTWQEYNLLFVQRKSLQSYALFLFLFSKLLLRMVYSLTFVRLRLFIKNLFKKDENCQRGSGHVSLMEALSILAYKERFGNGLFVKMLNVVYTLKNQFSFLNWQRLVHTNACGDFTLMSKEDWFALKAYPEWEIYSWHIDSVLLYQAYHSDIKMENLNFKYPIYHIEHGKGSGFTPEYANLLFQRLDDKGIGYLTDKDLEKILFDQYQQSKNQVTISYNNGSWGAFGEVFSENTPTVELKKASA